MVWIFDVVVAFLRVSLAPLFLSCLVLGVFFFLSSFSLPFLFNWCLDRRKKKKKKTKRVGCDDTHTFL